MRTSGGQAEVMAQAAVTSAADQTGIGAVVHAIQRSRQPLGRGISTLSHELCKGVAGMNKAV